jgi:gamma-glutamylcyclotransferase (GGCT)/AIG2-like uncharacterized protein YtfP
MAYLFSYGTLQDSEVQKAVFNRKLKGWPDKLPGFELSKTKAYDSYPIVVRTNDTSQRISGMAYQLENEELEKADTYEGSEYTRILVDLESGKKAWLYVGA